MDYPWAPDGVKLRYRKWYPSGVAALRVVIHAYHPYRICPDVREFMGLSLDDKWRLAASHWRRMAAGIAHVEAERKTKRTRTRGGKSFQQPIETCYPAGYLCETRTKTQTWGCARPTCLFCHARSVGRLVVALLKAHSRRPGTSPDRPFYAGLVTMTRALSREGRSNPQWASKWFGRHRVAGGVAFRYLEKSRGKGKQYYWRYKIIAVSDSAEALRAAGVDKVVAVHNHRMWLANKAAKWLRFPKTWAWPGRPARMLADTNAEYDKTTRPDRAGAWRYRAFGVCTDSYVPGKSWNDFAALEWKPPADMITLCGTEPPAYRTDPSTQPIGAARVAAESPVAQSV